MRMTYVLQVDDIANFTAIVLNNLYMYSKEQFLELERIN